MAYFDNAATTYPKPECVYSFMDKFYRNYGFNVGRGHYTLSQKANNLIVETRNKLKDLLHCPNKQVIFEPTATISLNLIIQGIILNGAKNIYISPFEHNAVTRTLNYYEKKKDIKVHVLAVSKDLNYDLMRIRYQFDKNTPDFVIVSHASNSFGVIAPVEEIFKIAKEYNAITLVDMAQTAGLVDCNIGSSVYDFAVFAGHKTLYGPTGISGFVMNPDIQMPTIIFGGTGFDSANQYMPDDLPERFEAGTLNILGIAGLNAALNWIQQKGISILLKVELENRKKLINILKKFWFINIVGNNESNEYVGIVSCLINGISSDSAGNIFDKFNIAVRTGLHCAPLAHKFMNTYPAGTVRFSVNYFTSDKDFEELEKALEFIEDNI